MRLTDRDKLVLKRTITILPWFGLMCWALSYSFWLGAAFILYVNLDRIYFSKFWGPASFTEESW